MAQLFRNNAFSSLASALTDVATTLTVATSEGDNFPAVTGADFALITLQDASNNIEIVKVTSRLGGADAMTIERAQEGTTARAWSLGDIVELRVTAFGLNPLALFAGSSTSAAIRAILDVPTRAGGDATGTWSINTSGTAANITGVASAVNGGTGQSVYAVGDILFASTTTALTRLADVATGNVLLSGGVGVAPAYGKVGMATHVSGILGVDNGGTGVATLTGVAFGNGTGAFSVASAAQIVAAIGATAVTNATNATNATTAVNVSGVVAVANGGTGASDGGNLAQPGDIKFVTKNVAPTGWLKANGATLTRATYPALWAAVDPSTGGAGGAGNGTTTFTIPDLRGEFIRGWDDSRGVDSGRVFGSTQTATGFNDITDNNGVVTINNPDSTTALATTTGFSVTGVGGRAVNRSTVRPRNVALLACIKF